MSVDMTVNLGGVQMQNPICTASGTFGFGYQYESFFDVSCLGAITLKGTSSVAWDGNPAPRMCEVCSGMMNSVGLANPGVQALVKTHGSYLRELEQRGCRVIAQAIGHSISECIAATEALETYASFVSGIELNISCPNLARGGRLLGGSAHEAAEVVREVRKHCTHPLWVKIGPVNVPEIARAVEAEGADALSLINTISGMAIDVGTRKSKLAMPTGGVSGPAIHPIAVRMVWEAAQAVSIPINGMGGVSSGQDAAEMILAGATAVSVGTTSFAEPTAAERIADELEVWAEEQGVSDIHALIGAVEL